MKTRGDEASEIRQQTEIALHVPNNLNLLARLFANLAAQSENIQAWCFYSDHGRATILLVTGNESEASRVLRAIGFDGTASPVVVVGLKHESVSATQLSAGLRTARIRILDTYACCSRDNGTVLVLRTTDDSRVGEVLETIGSQRAPALASSGGLDARAEGQITGENTKGDQS